MANATKELLLKNFDNSIEDISELGERKPETAEELEALCDEVFSDSDSSCEEEVIDFESRPRTSGPIQFPTSKPKHYSKDRRYVPIPKKSDSKKSTIRSTQGKGAKHRKLSFKNP